MAVSATIRIDPTLCRGHAICAVFFSSGIELDQWGYGKITDMELQDERALTRARRAASACPNGALVVEEAQT